MQRQAPGNLCPVPAVNGSGRHEAMRPSESGSSEYPQKDAAGALPLSVPGWFQSCACPAHRVRPHLDLGRAPAVSPVPLGQLPVAAASGFADTSRRTPAVSAKYTTAVTMKPTTNVMSPSAGTAAASGPVYSGLFQKGKETTIPASMATTPCQGQ